VGRTLALRTKPLHSLVDWTHNLISGTERAVLRRFSILVGSFTLQAAEAVANLPVGGRSMDASEMLAALDQLVVKSLVQANPEETPPRYRLLDTMRAYARTKLADSGEGMGEAGRHATVFRPFLP